MKSHKRLTAAVVLVLVISATAVLTASAAPPAQGPTTRQIASSGTTSPQPAAEGSDELAFPEFPGAVDDSNGPGGDAGVVFNSTGLVNRSLSKGKGPKGASVNSGKKAKSNPELVSSFDGLRHRDQRLANNGNQFSLEPPDQGLCVGNGFVLETVNDVLRVYNTSGSALIGVVDLNTFYGYPAAINRTTGVRGPFVTDPSCYFDQPTQRWFHVVLTLDSFANGRFTGKNHLDLAVSQTADPTGSWKIYRIPIQDDGTDGTPNHNCAPGPGSQFATNPNACLGDFPHIGADANGFYITTNEYDLFGPSFKSAQLYALSKAALASGASSVAVTQFDTSGLVAGKPGFTVWPASTPGTGYVTDFGGTEYFLSSMAAEEAGNTTGVDNRLAIWALTNTSSLNTSSPALNLGNSIITVNSYALPPRSDQKSGPFPLGQCLNDSTMATPFGLGCWRFFFVSGGPFSEVESTFDSSDTRMMQVVFANGKLWGALDTAVTVDGATKAGIAWYIIKPTMSSAGVTGRVDKQGYLSLANNNLSYPAIGVTPSGRGVMAFTLAGADHYPSAAYAAIDAQVGVGDIHVIAEGTGPTDGFTSYKAFVGSPPRTRWGDYGAAAADGNTIWVASEYIGPAGASPCTLSQFAAGFAFNCNRTRTSLGNWFTRISRLTP